MMDLSCNHTHKQHHELLLPFDLHENGVQVLKTQMKARVWMEGFNIICCRLPNIATANAIGKEGRVAVAVLSTGVIPQSLQVYFPS
ncbi:unnamed protein product [Lactuca virosa]|uniref:Uncharacterized protein n=1 Tax=Lactuca virosa TaxID=75947 RepID=A0AAU9LYL8_9ASTR|nr:unnamed protein product [Lactuca virosa]